MDNKNETTAGKHKTVIINRTFDLPLETVWKAWTEPESFKKWWGPENYTCPDCTIDLREGGKYLASMQDKKTGQKTWSTGTYKEIEPLKKLVYSDSFSDEKGNVTGPPEGMPGQWPKEQLVTVTLKDNNGKTDFTLNHADMPIEVYEDCMEGWQQCFDKLESNLE